MCIRDRFSIVVSGTVVGAVVGNGLVVDGTVTLCVVGGIVGLCVVGGSVTTLPVSYTHLYSRHMSYWCFYLPELPHNKYSRHNFHQL